MRIGIILRGFSGVDLRKCSGLIAAGLVGVGHEVTVFSFGSTLKTSSYGFSTSLPNANSSLYKTTVLHDLEPDQFTHFDVMIVYTWLTAGPGRIYLRILRTLRGMGKKVIVKADSDGRLGYPIIKRYEWRELVKYASGGKAKLRALLGWPIKRLLLPQLAIQDISENFRLSDCVVIETPQAADNIKFLLKRNKKLPLEDKLRIIPNPVHKDFLSVNIEHKENIVLCIGRWNDQISKNTKNMVKGVREFLEKETKYRAIVVGPFPEPLRVQYMHPRLKITGPIANQEMPAIYASAKIFLLPSNFESFGIAAAEALLSGCSVVSTPTEAGQYFVQKGEFGTASSSWNSSDISEALQIEAAAWDNGTRVPSEIRSYWSNLVSMESVAKKYHNLISSILQ